MENYWGYQTEPMLEHELPPLVITPVTPIAPSSFAEQLSTKRAAGHSSTAVAALNGRAPLNRPGGVPARQSAALKRRKAAAAAAAGLSSIPGPKALMTTTVHTVSSALEDGRDASFKTGTPSSG